MLEDSIKRGFNSFIVVVFINTEKIIHITMWDGTDGKGSFGTYNGTQLFELLCQNHILIYYQKVYLIIYQLL